MRFLVTIPDVMEPAFSWKKAELQYEHSSGGGGASTYSFNSVEDAKKAVRIAKKSWHWGPIAFDDMDGMLEDHTE